MASEPSGGDMGRSDPQCCSECGHPMQVRGDGWIEMYRCIRVGCPGGDPVGFGEVDPI